MNQIGLIHPGNTLFLAQYRINQYSIFRSDYATQDVIRQIIDFNLYKAEDSLLVLKKNSSIKGVIFSKIHLCSVCINQILINQKFYFALIKTALSFIGYLGLGVVTCGSFIIGLTSLILIVLKLSLMVQIKLFMIGRILNLHKLIWMLVEGIQPQVRFIQQYCSDLFQSAKDDLGGIGSRIFIESQISYSNYLVDRKKISCYGFDEKAILNNKNSFGRCIDPINGEYFETNITAAKYFRLGRFVIPLTSLVSYLIQADSETLGNIEHPVFKNRLFSDSEVESLKHDIGNFFSCDLEIFKNIFKITLNDQEKASFSTKASDVLAFIKAVIFYHYIASTHPLFNPEVILKKDIFSELSESKQHLVLEMIALKEKSLFL